MDDCQTCNLASTTSSSEALVRPGRSLGCNAGHRQTRAAEEASPRDDRLVERPILHAQSFRTGEHAASSVPIKFDYICLPDRHRWTTTDPFWLQYECRLCLTLHNNEGNYLAHTQARLSALLQAVHTCALEFRLFGEPTPHSRCGITGQAASNKLGQASCQGSCRQASAASAAEKSAC